ncbi:TetR family transcriptional regulator [Microbacterium sp. X-17]|uniref:TetR/AcrR family transcriptional regulator n=1 Tax=Microbacterium sp. X-17 TaxID=3144404 RepID=UPI0031F4F610
MSAAAATASVRRFDPDRRDRIIDACLDVIAAEGVTGTSHRKVAAVARVPLGSMTYHFSGMEDLLFEAFTRFADRSSDTFTKRMRDAETLAQAQEVIADLINEDVSSDPRDLVITHELYTLAAREPRFRTITQHWMGRSREALGLHFDPATARILDALIEGLTLHRAFDAEADLSLAMDAVRRVTLQRI